MSQTDTPARGRVSVLLPGLVNFIYQKKDPAEAFRGTSSSKSNIYSRVSQNNPAKRINGGEESEQHST